MIEEMPQTFFSYLLQKRAQEKIEREFRNYAQEARYAMESLGDI